MFPCALSERRTSHFCSHALTQKSNEKNILSKIHRARPCFDNDFVTAVAAPYGRRTASAGMESLLSLNAALNAASLALSSGVVVVDASPRMITGDELKSWKERKSKNLRAADSTVAGGAGSPRRGFQEGALSKTQARRMAATSSSTTGSSI